jgi:hypothetical protein
MATFPSTIATGAGEFSLGRSLDRDPGENPTFRLAGRA